MAGLTSGPYVGLGAGLIGGVERMSIGGSNVEAAAIGPVIGGLFYAQVYLFNKRELLSTKSAVLFTIVIESFVPVVALLIRAMNGSSSSSLWLFSMLPFR
ncbi:MAG: LytS/YhcK type 5TM receptor domain-containing protein [Methanomicrobiales archaeon]